MKKFLITGSSLVAVAAAGSAGAVDVTLGGTIDMSVEYGVKKGTSVAFGSATGDVTLSLAAAGTTDGGIKYGGSFSLGTAASLVFGAWTKDGADILTDGGLKALVKATVAGAQDVQGVAYNVSGGAKITEDKIVGVKINSSWVSKGGTVTGYGIGLGLNNSANVCKLAGHIGATLGAPLPADVNLVASRSVGNRIDIATASGYLPAGQAVVTAAAAGAIAAQAAATAPLNTFTVKNSAGADIEIQFAWDAIATATVNQVVQSKFAFDIDDPAGEAAATKFEVTSAAAYVGPFMEVKLQSSTTKMVVGAVCVTGKKTSDTKFMLNNESDIVTASGAKIFVDGGFGKITMQTSDYAGKVSSIGEAGDEAGIGADGLVVIAEGTMMGATVFGAVDLDGALQGMETLFGASLALGGLNVAFDYEATGIPVLTDSDGNTANVTLSAWDLGASYSLGDIDAAFAFDSDGDFGASADMSLAGLNVGVELSSRGNVAHEKTGLDYSASVGTSMNGMSVGFSFDQDMKASGTVGYDIGNLNIYAGYDGAEEGGKIGAKLSF